LTFWTHLYFLDASVLLWFIPPPFHFFLLLGLSDLLLE
jgi:hypothetical protein